MGNLLYMGILNMITVRQLIAITICLHFQRAVFFSFNGFDILLVVYWVARHEFTHNKSQVRVTSSSHEPSSSQDPSFHFCDFFLLFISYGCYFRLHNDVLVANRKNYKCLVCNIAIFFIIDRLSHYCYDSLSLYKDIPHTYLMKFLRRLTPVFAYTWNRDSISAAEKARGEGLFKYPLLNRHFVYFHRTPKIKCNASRTYSLRGRNVDSHVIFLSNTIAR